MKTSIYLYILSIMTIIGISNNSYGQEINKGKPVVAAEQQRQKQERNFYRKTLQVDSLKANQVSQIQDAYKAGLKAIIADTSLNETAKRARISALMETKNRQLRSMLSPAQQEKIIPSTERTSSKFAKP